jgi:hypothetical protein
MAVHLFSGRILSASLAKSIAVFLVVSFGAAAPARADHYLTHPASGPAGPSVATLADQAGIQAGTRGAAQNAARNATRNAPGAPSRAAPLFRDGTEIKIKKDASVYITSRNIPKNDRLLETYNADRPNSGRVRTQAGEATAVPGLLGIANQAHRAQDPNGRNAEAYSLADAMRDAVWRKNTAARLKSLTASQNACAVGNGKRTPSIGLAASC